MKCLDLKKIPIWYLITLISILHKEYYRIVLMKKCTSAACHTCCFFHLCDIGGCTELGTLEQSSLTYLCPSPNVSNDESSSGSNIAILYQLSN